MFIATLASELNRTMSSVGFVLFSQSFAINTNNIIKKNNNDEF